MVLRTRSEEAEKIRDSEWWSREEEEEGSLEMKKWRKSKGVTERNRQSRFDMTQSSIL